jgi:hypothetical protein
MNTSPQKEDEFSAACVPQKVKKRGQNLAVLNYIVGLYIDSCCRIYYTIAFLKIV